MSIRAWVGRTSAAVAIVLGVAGPVWAQDLLARAKDFYASAAYEEALQVLQQLDGKSATPEGVNVAAYRVYCLLALGRRDEAKVAIGAIVRTDPLFHPSDAQTSPRVRAFFEEVRKPLLPEVLSQSYAKAKALFDRKEMAEAAVEFDRAIALLDELGAARGEGGGDLRTLAVGFRDLSRSAIAPPAPAPTPTPAADPVRVDPPTDGDAAPPPVATPAPTPTPEPERIYGSEDENVSRPVAVARAIPTWIPPTLTEKTQDFRGVVELVVDERGKVTSAVLTKKIHPSYDPMLLKAAQGWTFRPALKNGVPVKYRYLLEVKLAR
jgi:tetratricopeptide (TPR) repeat protein